MQQPAFISFPQRMKTNLALAMLYILKQQQRGIEKYLLGFRHRNAMLGIFSGIPIIPIEAPDIE